MTVLRRALVITMLVLGGGALLAPAALAANKEMQALQAQITNLQGQIADLQRALEDNVQGIQREMKRLSDLVAEANATQKRAQQDQRLRDEAVQSSLRDMSDRLSELREKFQTMPAAPVPAPTGADPLAPAPTPPPRRCQRACHTRGRVSRRLARSCRAAPAHRRAAARALQPGLRRLRARQLRPRHPGVPGVPARTTRDRLHRQRAVLDRRVPCTRSSSTRRRSRPGTSCCATTPSSDKLPDARVKKGMALERLGRRSRGPARVPLSSIERYPQRRRPARKAREKLATP